MGLKDLYSLGALKTKIQQEFNKFQQAFTQHATGSANRHTASTIDVSPVLIDETTVQGVLEKIAGGYPFALNVKIFGAIGDGITDDTAAIIAAIAAVPQNGGRVFFPAGSYKITTTLAINIANRPIELCGVGTGEQIHGTPAGVASMLIWGGSTPAPVIDINNEATRVTIRDLVIDNAVSGANAATHGIRAVSSPNLRIENVLMFPSAGLGFATAGIEIGGASGNPLVGATLTSVYVRNCTVGLLTKTVISLLAQGCRFIECEQGVVLGTATTTSIAVQFFGCVFEARTGDTDVNIVRAQSVLFSGCQLDAYGPQRAVDILSTAILADSIEFHSCRFIGVNNASYGLKIDFASASVLFSSCFFTSFATAAINNVNNKLLTIIGCHDDENDPIIDNFTNGSVRAIGNNIAATGPAIDRLGATAGLAIGSSGAAISAILTAQTQWRPNGGAAINNGAAAIDGTITVTGAAKGNTVVVGFNPAGVDTTPAGCLFIGTVTAPNTVVVSLLNFSGGSLTYNSNGDVRVDVIQH